MRMASRIARVVGFARKLSGMFTSSGAAQGHLLTVGMFSAFHHSISQPRAAASATTLKYGAMQSYPRISKAPAARHAIPLPSEWTSGKKAPVISI